MRILIVDSGEENRIKKVVSCYAETVGEVSCICVGTSEPIHEIYAIIKSSKAELVLTFDDTSLLFKSELGGCSLNRIPAKMIHFVTEAHFLKHFKADVGFNLSHFVVVPRKETETFLKEHEMIPNVAGYEEENIPEALEHVLKELWCL